MRMFGKLSILIACAGWLVLGGTTAVVAQEDPPNIVDAWVVVPKEGHGAQFEQAFKKHIAMRAEKGDPRSWQIYVPVTGDDLNRYVIRYCCFEWKDQDAYIKWGQSAGTGEHWADIVDPHVAHYEHYFGEIDMENSHWPEQGPPAYVGATDFRIKMGAGPAMQADKAAMSKAAKEMNWPYSWSWGSRVGGESSMTLVVPYENYAAMEPPEKTFAEALSEKMGAEDAGALFQSWTGHFEKVTYTIWRHREDMSMEMASE
jgi:hypothetical protein